LLALQEARARERRLAAVGQLAAGVMHDVNNALNPIMAAAFLLEANADNPVAVRDYAVRIAKAAETGAATAARVVASFAKNRASGARRTSRSVGHLRRGRCDDSSALGRARARRHNPPRPRPRRGRHRHGSRIAGELREALLNLVQNALDAMAGGGTLGMRTMVTDTEAQLEVRDSGIGMSAEVRERAFDRSSPPRAERHRARPRRVYGIVKRHRGRAEIESDAGAARRFASYSPRPRRKRSRTSRLRNPGRGFHDESCSSRIIPIAVSSCRRFSSRTVTRWTPRAESWMRWRCSSARRRSMSSRDGHRLGGRERMDLITFARERWKSMRIGVVTGWEPRVGAGADGDFILRKPVRHLKLLAQVAGEG